MVEPSFVERMRRDIQRRIHFENNSPSSLPTRGSAGETEHDVDDSPPILFSTPSKFNYNINNNNTNNIMSPINITAISEQIIVNNSAVNNSESLNDIRDNNAESDNNSVSIFVQIGRAHV